MQRLAPLFELAFWLGLALLAFALSFSFSGEVGTYEWGAASWPRAVILLMAIAAVVQYLVRRARPGPAIFEEADEGGSVLPLVGLFLIPLVYAWLLPRTGFYLTTPVFLVIFLLHVGERRWMVILGTTVIISIVVNLIFTKLFYVALPVGNWPGFYDVNNWLLTVIR